MIGYIIICNRVENDCGKTFVTLRLYRDLLRQSYCSRSNKGTETSTLLGAEAEK